MIAMKDKKSSMGNQRNVWKIVSIVFIALFIVVLIWGQMNLRSRHHFAEPTQEQIDSAKSIVSRDLQAMGDSMDNYQVSVTNRIMGFIGGPRPDEMPPMGQIMPLETESSGNLQISLRSNTTNYLYLVDIDSGKILMRSFTEWLN